MKKIITLLSLFAAVSVFTGCNDMDKPSPLDTRAGGANSAFGGASIPTSEFGDPNAGDVLAERSSGFDNANGAGGANYDNPNAEDVIATVYFGFDQYAVPQSERAKVKSTANALKANEALKVVLVAHTDAFGTEEYNLALSDKRGAAVLAYLSNEGVSHTRAEIVARGENNATPNVAKDSPQAKQDRRVDIIRIR